MSEVGTTAPAVSVSGSAGERNVKSYLPAALILIPLFLFAVATLTRYLKPAAPLLPVQGVVPDFQLTRSDGKPLALEDLRGHIWIAGFIFTRCPGTCGAMSTRMEELQKATVRAEDLRLVSISVDPQYDTPEVLGAYAKNFDVDPRRWFFLTGPRDAIYRLAEGGFKLSAVPDGTGLITHSDRLALVDAQGRIRGTYSGTEPDALPALLKDLERLYREPRP